MLFQNRFHPGIRDGTITQTFRVWASPRVKTGGIYRVGRVDAVTVRTVTAMPFGDVTDTAARKAGFDDADTLEAFLRRTTKTAVTARTRVYRVTFRHQPWKPSATPTLGVEETLAKLEAMEQRTRRAPWITDTLNAIGRRPRTAASRLAAELGRAEVPAFKADVRKLKKLGLTRSHEVGYELTDLGKKVRKRRRA
ncbi:MAG: hypothetical protein HKO59_17130 [Phycisphaerales bacterium]|nr:hypothetical protein [Phycisphaerales bacterium]NNM27674.1 hypothetical protein [Phycisphaerales bacterium]